VTAPRVTLRDRLLARPRVGAAARAALAGVRWLAAPSPEIRRWREIDGDRTLRLDYDLTPDSVVLDVGGFEGQWTSDIVAMYGCRVHVFEPVPAFADRIAARFARNPRVTVHRYGLAAGDGTEPISLAGDASSVVRAGNAAETISIELRRARDVLDSIGPGRFDLVKLNIEGAEYDLIEHLADEDLMPRIRDLQVQFHSFVVDAPERMSQIRSRLARTHEPTFQFDFVWENWRLRAELDSQRSALNE
jgi:FkbM family methyltransferase